MYGIQVEVVVCESTYLCVIGFLCSMDSDEVYLCIRCILCVCKICERVSVQDESQPVSWI